MIKLKKLIKFKKNQKRRLNQIIMQSQNRLNIKPNNKRQIKPRIRPKDQKQLMEGKEKV